MLYYRINKNAFTLIELMVATAIFMIIVFILSSAFHQGTVAWDAGTRKAEGNMTARSVLGFMAKELATAVADTNWLQASINDGANVIEFVTLKGERSEETVDTTNRLARKIRYRLVGDVIKRTEWKRDGDVSGLLPNSYGGNWVQAGPELAIAERVTDLRFYTSDGKNYTTNLPAWIRIELSVRRTDDISGVGAMSAGPDGIFEVDESKKSDDIRSW
jgi:prepilin-type N-terminal cleavage/methylation domain-containing protein